MYIESVKFSLWCDFLERNFLSDEFEILIKDDIINGATSNPAIFNQAFLNSLAYKDEIQSLKDKDPKEIYETLAFKDIADAAKKLFPLYEKGDDGFVSIEVDPFLANDANGSIQEGRKIAKMVQMPNIMIKIPATQAGYEAMETLTKEGLNVNATLIFSPSQAQKSLDAMQRGIEDYIKTNPSKRVPKGVISVFVSRFDRKLDEILDKHGLPKGKVGIMNASKVYNIIQKSQTKHIRTLFASTGVKGDDFEADYYIKELLFPNSINTAPLATINAFVAQGNTDVKSVLSDDEIDSFFDDIKGAGIDFQEVCKELMDEGMDAFEKAFEEILQTLKR